LEDLVHLELSQGLKGLLTTHLRFKNVQFLVPGSQSRDLYSHIYLFHISVLEKISLHDEIPLHTWFCRGFAGVLHESALARLWDKVASGAIKVLAFVIVALVEAKKIQLMACQTAKEAIRCLTTVRHNYLHNLGKIHFLLP
jgi:hypothetical protein